MAQYVYDMTKQIDRDKLDYDFEILRKFFTTKKFKSFIADKCLEIVKDICNDTEFWYEHSVWASKVEEYKHGHKVEIGNDYVLIFNDTYYEPEELWWLSEDLKEKYPDGLSVSYLIEYGMGIRGIEADDWEVNVRGKGEKWYYHNPDVFPKSTLYFSQTGRLIYLKLAMEVEQRFEDWANEYIQKEIW